MWLKYGECAVVEHKLLLESIVVHHKHHDALNQDNEIAVHLGEVLWVKGKHEEALKLFRDVQQKDASSELLGSTLKRLKIKRSSMKENKS